MELRQIENFGAIDAESDDLLMSCFEQHPAFQEVLEGRRFLVIGRKGSGKTAIFKKILSLREDPLLFSVGHNFSDYPWDFHDQQVIDSAAEQERYLHSWRYLILMTLAKILLNFDNSQPWSEDAFESLKKIENFVVDTYGSRDPDITEIFHPGKRLRHLKSFNIDLKVLGFTVDDLEMNNLPRVYQDVNRNVQAHILNTLNPSNKYFLCFDQLDIGFQPTSEQYKQRLIGLILAARDFASVAREHGKNLKILVFLRSDIYYNSLLFEDKNKITDTYLVKIDWDQPGQETTLKSLMERRFSEVLIIDRNGAWNNVFNETAEMRGHQSKYQHILDRTFNRPRDIIKFCNLILSVYKNRMAEGRTKSHQFGNEDVNLAKYEYSNYLRDEITDEIHKYYPDFGIYFEILRQIGYQLFNLDNFLEAYEIWKDRLETPTHPVAILECLYEFSIIGVYRAGGSGYGGSEYIYKYLDQRAEFNRQAERFRVHWGLVETLGLRQYSRS